MADVFRTIIVPAANVDQCRAIAALLPGGVGAFSVPLNGGTHFISSGLFNASVAELLERPVDLAAFAGMSVQQAEDLRAVVHISSRGDVHIELAELGLSLEQP